MKLISANELRAMSRSNEDQIAAVIDTINARLKQHQRKGMASALIGFMDETACFASLPELDQAEVRAALEIAGYRVVNGPRKGTIRVHWDKERED